MYQSGKSTSYQQFDQNSISDSLPISNPTQPIATCVFSNSIQQSSSSPQQLPSQISPEFYAAYLASLSQPIPNSIIPNDYPNPTNGASYDPRQQSTMQSTTGNPLPFNYPVQGITGMACVLSPSQPSSWNSNVKSDPSAIAQLNNSAPLMISSTTFDNSPKLSEENNCRDASNKIIVEQHSDSMSVSCSQKPDSHLDPAFFMTPETSAADNSALNTSHPEPRTICTVSLSLRAMLLSISRTIRKIFHVVLVTQSGAPSRSPARAESVSVWVTPLASTAIVLRSKLYIARAAGESTSWAHRSIRWAALTKPKSGISSIESYFSKVSISYTVVLF